MESQTVQPTLLDAQTLKQLQDEIQQEMYKILNKSELDNVLKKYGISAEEVLRIQYILDLTKYQSSGATQGSQAQKSLLGNFAHSPIEVALKLVRPCPIDNNPDGCWFA
ncbi:MAG: hypothetical protein ACYTXC_15825 [Nostoc sp.]